MLTRQEKNVARLLATEGLSNKAMAHRLGISDSTVKVHVRRVMSCLRQHGVTNRVQVAIHYFTRMEQLTTE